MQDFTSCTKVKNPCKVCLRTVNQKTGLQCQGTCESWVHYKCLNYTKGRIMDIKTGAINVMCPCPDCKSSLPKEKRVDEPFACTNFQCPANQPPRCTNNKCYGNDMPAQPPPVPTCPLASCGKGCQQNSNAAMDMRNEQRMPKAVQITGSSLSDACLGMSSNDCKISSQANVSGDGKAFDSRGSPLLVMEQVCNTIDLLSKQINDLLNYMNDEKSSSKSCTNRGPKKTCQKPCHCPSNPVKK